MSYHAFGSETTGVPGGKTDAPASSGRPLPIRVTPDEEKGWEDDLYSALPALLAVGLLVTILAVSVRVAEFEETTR